MTNTDNQTYLGTILPSLGQDGTTKNLPKGPEIDGRTGMALQAREDGAFVTLSEGERAQVGEPATLSEMEVNAAAAEALTKIGADPEIMQHLNLDTGKLPKAFAVDTALLQAEGAVDQAVEVGQEVAIFLASDVTECVDLCMETEAQMMQDDAESEDDLRAVQSALYPVNQVEAMSEDKAVAATQRSARKTARHKQGLALHDVAGSTIQTTEELATASLSATPTQAAKPAKRKPGKPRVARGRALTPRKRRPSSGGTPAGSGA